MLFVEGTLVSASFLSNPLGFLANLLGFLTSLLGFLANLLGFLTSLLGFLADLSGFLQKLCQSHFVLPPKFIWRFFTQPLQKKINFLCTCCVSTIDYIYIIAYFMLTFNFLALITNSSFFIMFFIIFFPKEFIN